MLEITSLPARQGDALWIRWGDADAPHQMFIDMGTEPVGRKIRARLEALEPDARHFDLLVITHVDADHIGGVLTAVAEVGDELDGLAFDDVWFNGWDHLHGRRVAPGIEPMGGAQGERLGFWLRGQRWNAAFDHRPVQRDPDADPVVVELHDGLQLTVLGPTPERLRKLIAAWEDNVFDAIDKGKLDPDHVTPGMGRMGAVPGGIEAMGAWTGPPVLESLQDLEDLAATKSKHDRAAANGSSIALLLEYDGHALMLAADAFADDLCDAIAALNRNGPLVLDLCKLPHHGSRNNVHRALVEAVDCPAWLFSTDGTQFNHPDPEAVARVIHYGNAGAHLLFNATSEYNACWASEDWQRMFGYSTEYAEGEDGIVVRYD
jgi:hypothetical protein